MNEYKLFAQRIGVIGAASLATSLSSIILLPILTKSLQIQDYGVWVQVTVIIGLMPSLVALGLPNAMMRFLAAAKSKEEISEGFYSIILTLTCLSGAVSLLFFLLAKPIADVLLNHEVQVAYVIPPLLFFAINNTFLLFYFRTFQQVKRFSMFQLIQTYLGVVLISAAIFAGYGLLGAIRGMLIAQIIVFVMLVIFIVRDIGFTFPKFKNLREYLAFGLPVAPVGLTSWIVDSSDRFIINVFLGTTSLGYYSPGYALGNLIQLFSMPQRVLLPAALPKYHEGGEKHHVANLLTYSLKYTLFLSIPAIFGLTLLSKPILTMLSTQAIAQQGFLITPFVGLGTLLLLVSEIVCQPLLLEKETRVLGIAWLVAALLNLVLTFFAVPYLGIIGAAASTFVAYAIFFLITFYYSRRAYRFDLNLEFILKCLFASSVISVVLIIWNPSGALSVLASIFCCSLIYTGGVFLLRGFTREEITFFRGLFRLS